MYIVYLLTVGLTQTNVSFFTKVTMTHTHMYSKTLVQNICKFDFFLECKSVDFYQLTEV